VTPDLLQRRLRYGHFIAAGFFVFAALSLAISSAADSAKSVLVLYGERLQLPAIGAVQRGLDAALRADKKVDIFSEFLDFARFPTQSQREELASHLKSRYAGRRFDLVVTVAGSALSFALDYRQDLFAGVPIVFCAVDRREIEGRDLPADVIGLPINFDFRGTLDLAFRLQPKTEEVVCIAGTAGFDRLWAEQCQQVLDGYRERVRYRFIGTGPIGETLSAIHKLSPKSIVLYISILRDGHGESFVPMEVAGHIVQESNVAVYGLASIQLEQGIVGGSLFDFTAHGEETGQLCQKLLSGGSLDPGHLQPAKPNALVVNWRALQKWKIAKHLVPSNATIRFREPSLWQEHRALVVGAVLFAIIETVLLLALLRSLARLHRTRHELNDRLRFERLIAGLSARFVNIPPEKVDSEVERALDEVVESMKLDHCALFELLGDRAELRITHKSQALDAGILPFPPSERRLPWFFGQISSGKAVILHDAAEDLPGEAVEESAFCREFGIRSALAFPFFQSGAATRGILYASANQDEKWSNEVIPDLQSIGQILASALAQKDAEESLRENEATISLAAQSADLGLWSRDMQTGRIWATARTRIMYGFSADGEVTFGRFLESLHPDDRATTEKAIAEAVADRCDYNIIHRIVRTDGAVRWMTARGRTIYSAAGQALKMMGASFDITERRQRALETEGHRQELAHLGRVALMGEMAASLAHELNQPLTAIVTNAGAGQRFVDQGVVDIRELHELLLDIASDGERAGKIIRGIREMVRKGDTPREVVDMNQVVKDVVRLTNSDAVRNSCAIVTEFAPQPAWVEADAVQIQQVFLNLVLNAFDAIQETPTHLRRVVLSTNSAVDGVIRTAVRDFGPGLSKKVRQRVFEHFFSTKKDGLGMGLAIARSIVESFGGSLDGTNAPDGGAVFYFNLPAYIDRSK
jgi:two-component system, LuxR family, sensor kinase FixL